MHVPNGTGPGVRRSKRSLSACYTRRKCSMETSNKSVKGWGSVKRSRIGIKSDWWRVVIVFGQAKECHEGTSYCLIRSPYRQKTSSMTISSVP